MRGVRDPCTLLGAPPGTVDTKAFRDINSSATPPRFLSAHVSAAGDDEAGADPGDLGDDAGKKARTFQASFSRAPARLQYTRACSCIVNEPPLHQQHGVPEASEEEVQ